MYENLLICLCTYWLLTYLLTGVSGTQLLLLRLTPPFID